MSSPVRLATACLLAGCWAIAACSDETPPGAGSAANPSGSNPTSGTSPRDAAQPAPSVCPTCQPVDGPLPLGGETSEFDGVIERGPASTAIPPPEIATPRPLSDPALARWLELVEGEREFSLRWRERFRDAGTSGHAPATRLVLSVSALRAFDVEFDAARPEPTVYLEVAVDLRSDDGAIDSSFVHLLDLDHLGQYRGSEHAESARANAPYPLSDWRGSLALGLDPEREVAGSVQLDLSFSSEHVRGRLTALVQYPLEPVRQLLTGSFPDDGCSVGEWPLPLDAEPEGLGQSLGSGLEGVAAALRAPSLSARDAAGARQPLALELGAADHACAGAAGANVYAPLRLRSGALDLIQEARVQLRAGPVGEPLLAGLWTRREFVAADRLDALTRITPPAGATYAGYLAPRIQANLLAPDNVDGRLLLELFGSDAHPELLHWCSRDGCD